MSPLEIQKGGRNMSKKTPKRSDPGEAPLEEKNAPDPASSSWAQRHGGLVFLLLVAGIIGLALLYEFLAK